MSSFAGKNTIESAVKSLNALKSVVYNVNYVNKLLVQRKNNIIIAGDYTSILHPILLDNFNLSDNIFILINVPTDMNNYGNGNFYYSSNFLKFSNKSLNNPDDFIDPLFNYNYMKQGGSELSAYLNNMLKANPSNKMFYRFFLNNWTEGVQLCLSCIQPDILDNSKWIEVTSVINLNKFFKEITNKTTIEELFSSDRSVLNTVYQIMFDLETSNWNNQNLVQNIWEYSNISNINKTVCLYSKKYPEWIGKQIVDCNIPNSNINVQSMMTTLLNDIYLFYPLLTIGEIAITLSNFNGNNLLSLCKIDIYNGVQCIKVVKINLEKFFVKNIIIGDTIFNGNINIKDDNNNSVIQLDNFTKDLSFHGKMGINQDLHEIKALLDIDNLSNENILTIVDKIADLNNTSYNVINEVNDSIINSNTFNITPDYINEVVLFKVKNFHNIEEKDIIFLHKPSNIFKTSKFSNESFLKIQTIVNEINKMSYEMYLFNREYRKMLTLSFVELLNDTEFYYLCSLKTVFYDSQIYFVMSYTLVQHIMIDNSYKTIFKNLIDNFSNLNRLLNYSILVAFIPEIYNQLLKGDSVNSFTKYIQEGPFSNRFGMEKTPTVFCLEYSGNTLSENNVGKFLFNELFTEWNSKYIKDLIMPGTDKNIIDISLSNFLYYQNNYGLYKNHQNFIVHYLFDNGEKIAFINRITITQITEEGEPIDVEYSIGVGMNLFDFIDLSISSIGDNKIGGNLYIKDENNSNVFYVDTEYNKIVNMYKTGFGTEEPKTIIDLNDCGLTEIINIIQDIAIKEHALNLNIGFIKNLDIINASNIDNCINTNFIDPNNTLGSKYQQSKDDYFYCQTRSNNPNEVYNAYTWLYRDWDNNYYVNIDDKNNKQPKETALNCLMSEIKTEYIYENLQLITTFEWTFGKKFCCRRLFKEKNSGKIYGFGNGVNIGNYNLKINNNGNISAFFDYMKYMNLYLQNFIIRYNNINVNNIQNYTSVNDYFNIISNVIPLNKFNLKKIVADFTNFKNTKVYNIDFNTFVESGNDLNKTIYENQNVVERNRYFLMLTNIKTIYGKNNTNLQLFNKGDYGIINTEDDYADFLSLFYCSEVNSTSATLISIELQINTIIQPSIDVKGDIRIKGDAYFHNDNTNTDFVSIDTNDSFFGIGTSDRYVNYNFRTLTTTTTKDLSRHKFIVSGSTYPVSVTERFAEIKPERDPITNEIINYPDLRLNYFANRVGVVGRRTSKYYSVNELYEYSKKYTTKMSSGPYKGQTKYYKYGIDYGFEIQDSSNITTQLGAIQMVIDSVDENNIILPGFGVEYADTLPNGTTFSRQALYINNDGVMNVDKIKLGIVDLSNENKNVLLSGSNNDLYINDISLQTIINNEIKKMFSLDSSTGILTVNMNGTTKNYQPM